jgi:Protein-L-isoaspartate(D-aspartate) O-methyltransferase (PCMT)
MPPVSNHINNNNINNNNNWNRTSLSSSSLLLLPLLRSYTQYSIVRRLLSVVIVVVLLLLPNEVVVATTSSRTTTCPTTANRCGNHHHHHQRTRNLQPLTQSDNYSTAFIKTPNTFSSTSSTTAASTGSRSSNSKNNNIITMKAWTCHGRNQRDMVHQLQQAGIIRSPQVQQVMSLVDRKNYFPTSTTSSSSIPNSHYYYEDAPYPIGYGQTISAPMYSKKLSLIWVRPQHRVPAQTLLPPRKHLHCNSWMLVVVPDILPLVWDVGCLRHHPHQGITARVVVYWEYRDTCTGSILYPNW